MHKTGKTLGLVATAAVVAGMTSPALAATARHESVSGQPPMPLRAAPSRRENSGRYRP